MTTFAEIIRSRMHELRMPIAEVAARIGVSTTRVRQLLNYQDNMTEQTFRRLCAAVYLQIHVTPIGIANREAAWPELQTTPWRAADETDATQVAATRAKINLNEAQGNSAEK